MGWGTFNLNTLYNRETRENNWYGSDRTGESDGIGAVLFGVDDTVDATVLCKTCLVLFSDRRTSICLSSALVTCRCTRRRIRRQDNTSFTGGRNSLSCPAFKKPNTDRVGDTRGKLTSACVILFSGFFLFCFFLFSFPPVQHNKWMESTMVITGRNVNIPAPEI